MSTANRVLKNTLFLYGKIAVTSVCLILSTRYVLKGLGVEDFSVYNLNSLSIYYGQENFLWGIYPFTLD